MPISSPRQNPVRLRAALGRVTRCSAGPAPRLPAAGTDLAAPPRRCWPGPDWSGSGFKADPWWQHAVFYQVAEPGPPTSRQSPSGSIALDRSASTHCFCPRPALPAPGSNGACRISTTSTTCSARPAATAFASCSRIQAPSATADLSGLARFWLARGVAGLHIATPPGTSPDDTQAIVQNAAQARVQRRPDNASSSPTSTSRRPSPKLARSRHARLRARPRTDASDRAVADRYARRSPRQRSTPPAFARCWLRPSLSPTCCSICTRQDHPPPRRTRVAADAALHRAPDRRLR